MALAQGRRTPFLDGFLFADNSEAISRVSLD